MRRVTTSARLIVLSRARWRGRIASHRVDLGDAVDVGDVGREVGDPVGLGIDQHEGGQHGSAAYAGGRRSGSVGFWPVTAHATAAPPAATRRASTS